MKKAPHPFIDDMAGIKILPLDQPAEIRRLLGAIGEGPGFRERLQQEIRRVGWVVIEQDLRVEGQLLSLASKMRDGDAIAKGS